MACSWNNYLDLKLEGSYILRLYCKKGKFWFSMLKKYPCLKRLTYVLNFSQCNDLMKALHCMQKCRLSKTLGAELRAETGSPAPGAWASAVGGRACAWQQAAGQSRAGGSLRRRGSGRWPAGPRCASWVPPPGTAPCTRGYQRAGAGTAVFLWAGEMRTMAFWGFFLPLLI